MSEILPKKGTIRIAGAGPAGLAAAITLAQGGQAVEVWEKRSSAGHRYHNGFQILENYTVDAHVLDDFSTMGITTEFFQYPGHAVDFYDYKLRCRTMQAQQPFGYYVKRGPGDDTLDSALARQAESLGVKLHFHQTLPKAEADIWAVGATCPAGVAKEMVFRTDLPDTFITLLDNRLTPQGFAYLFVIDGEATIGAAILADFNNLNEYFDRVVARFQEIKPFGIEQSVTSGSFVQFYLPTTAQPNNQLLVGEAAGFQEYLFGLGIRRAVVSGYLAAQSLIQNQNYDDLWRRRFGPTMPLSVVNRWLFEKLGNQGASLAIQLAGNIDFRKLGRRLNKPDWLRRAAWPLIRRKWRGAAPSQFSGHCTWYRALDEPK